MRVRFVTALSLALAVAPIAPTSGQNTEQTLPAASSAAAPMLPPAPFVAAPPGSVFHFREGAVKHEIVVGKSIDSFVTFTADGKPRTTSLLGGVQPEYLTTRDQIEMDKIWPLMVGKKVRYRRLQPRGDLSWTDEITVLRTETVNIGGKPVDTYVVRWNSSAEYRSRWEGSNTVWYAPSLGWNVRVTFSDNFGVHYDRVLDSYELAPTN